MKSPLQKIVIRLFLLLISINCFSQEHNNKKYEFFETLDFFALQGKKNTEISHRINNSKWLKVSLSPEEINKPLVFMFPSAHIIDYDLIIKEEDLWTKLTPNYDLDGGKIQTRYPEYHFKSTTPFFYLKIPYNFNNVEQLILLERSEYKGSGVSTLMLIGLYYGLAIMSILINLGFFYISKDKTFIIYSLLVLAVALIFFHEDGMFYFLSNGKYQLKHLITWNFPIISFLLSYFIFHFLDLKEENKFTKIILTALVFTTILLAISYSITDKYMYLHILKHASLIVPILCFLISLSSFKKDIYMKILICIFILLAIQVLGYSWSISYDLFNSFLFNLHSLRVTMSLSIVIINIIIMLRIEKLNKQNQMYRTKIKDYIYELKQQKLASSLAKQEVFTQIPFEENSTLSHIDRIIMQLKEEFILTDRETDVLIGIWEGLTNQEIAENLSISLSTTKHHVSNLYTKLNVKNRSQTILLKESLLNQNDYSIQS